MSQFSFLREKVRREILILFILLAAGLLLRMWNLSDVALDHFDEGVYAFSALGITDPQQPLKLYPDQVRFSPPVYFSLVGLSYILSGGPSATAAILVNVIFGTLTILLVWWIGRTWFNASAGLAAATLVTFSHYHIALSRTGLTDIVFLFNFLLSMAAIVATFRSQKIIWAIAAGLLVGLAWNTKYHGWFALVVATGAVLPYYLTRRPSGLSLKKIIVFLGIIYGIALLCYLPWTLFIESQPGGYVALASYQRTMLSLQWFHNLWVHIQQLLFFEGIFSRFSVLLAIALVFFIDALHFQFFPRSIALLAIITLSAFVVGSSITAMLISILAIPLLLRKTDSLPLWILFCWLGFWGFMTPFYHPYARLILPFTIAAFLTAGAWISDFVENMSTSNALTLKPVAVTTLSATLVLLFSFLIPAQNNPWRSYQSMAKVAEEMTQEIPQGSRVVVVGEPELAYYLHLSGRHAFERLDKPSDWKKIEEPVYFITGVYVKRAPILREGVKKIASNLKLLNTYHFIPNDIRLLDDANPQEAKRFRVNPDDRFDLTLYRFFPN